LHYAGNAFAREHFPILILLIGSVTRAVLIGGFENVFCLFPDPVGDRWPLDGRFSRTWRCVDGRAQKEVVDLERNLAEDEVNSSNQEDKRTE